MLCSSRLTLDRALAGSGPRSCALGGGSLDLFDDALATRGSFDELGFDSSFLALDGLMLLRGHVTQLGLNLGVVGTSLLGRVIPVLGSSGELRLDQSLLLVELALLFLLASLAALERLLIVRLGTLSDRVELLSLASLSAGHALLDALSSSLLSGLLRRVASLTDQEHTLVMLASALLDASEAARAVRLSCGVLLADLLDDALALSALLAALPLLPDVDSLRVLSALALHVLHLALICLIQLFLNHLMSQLLTMLKPGR